MGRERFGREVAPRLNGRGGWAEGQVGVKDGPHSFDLDNWLAVVSFTACGYNPPSAADETSSPLE